MTAAPPGGPGRGARVEMRGESRDSSTFTQIGTQVIHQPPLPEQAFRPWAELAAPAGLSNLPRPGLFVGRAGELARLDAAMAGPGGVVVQAVHGLGGIGKSTLAARWAAAHAAELQPDLVDHRRHRRPISTPGWRPWRSRCSRR